ncbi:MAG: TRAM domain-containing protein [bacterium JZ-2024 1]
MSVRHWLSLALGSAGAYLGWLIGEFLNVNLYVERGETPPVWNRPLGALLFAIFAYLASDYVIRSLLEFNRKITEWVQRARPSRVLSAVIGAILGLVVAFLFGFPVFILPGDFFGSSPAAARLLYVAFATVVCYVFATLFAEINILANWNLDSPLISHGGRPKLLDTNAFIDQRVYPVLKTGFTDGPFFVPSVVLRELQFLADSHDHSRREKGRRGLDVVHELMEDPDIRLRILEADLPHERDIDSVVVKVARGLKATIITSDYNLNKIAAAYGVKVLNVNDLTSAVRPPVHHGDTLTIEVAKFGKEPGQGVGYLDDGTMVVVEDGEDLIGQKVEVTVNTILQTAAGRIIFARPSRS